MSTDHTRLKGNAPRRHGPYILGEIPHHVVVNLGRHIVHRLAVGQGDITGDDFGKIFADAVDGHHRQKPLGIADVEWHGCAWSVKTVKVQKPHKAKRVRLISGRNSADYSHGITDPRADISVTGRVALSIWNARVDEAMAEFDDLRIVVLMRDMSTLHFTLFEYAAERYVPSEYTWQLSKQKNLIGFDSSGIHRFTWQFHGAQFTIIRLVPASAYHFRITQHPAALDPNEVLRQVKFDDSWIEKVDLKGN